MQRKYFCDVNESEAVAGNLFGYVTQLCGEYALSHFRAQEDLAVFIIVNFDLIGEQKIRNFWLVTVLGDTTFVTALALPSLFPGGIPSCLPA